MPVVDLSSTTLVLAMLLRVLPMPAGSTAPPAAVELTRGMEVAAGSIGLRPGVLQAAMRAHDRAVAQGLTRSPILTVIDFSLPSRERRLWVLDLARGEVLAQELVAHGRATGGDIARWFSNRPGSAASSLGSFITGATYFGKHGLSLRLRGLDRGVNDRAESRAIVVHGADYVSEASVRVLGRLGRSLGCPALGTAVAPRIIGLIRGGSLLYAYHPAGPPV
jgi:hypothetical protein